MPVDQAYGLAKGPGMRSERLIQRWARRACFSLSLSLSLSEHRISYYRSRLMYDFCSSFGKSAPEANITILGPLLPFLNIVLVEKSWSSILPLIPLLANALLTHRPSIKCLVSVQWQKNAIHFLFNYTVTIKLGFNKRAVISPRTGVLHACLSLKRQKLSTFASGEKWFFVLYSLKGLQFRFDYRGDLF